MPDCWVNCHVAPLQEPNGHVSVQSSAWQHKVKNPAGAVLGPQLICVVSFTYSS